jgi:integrase
MGNSIHVERTYCLFWKRVMCELWDDLSPVIPANNYLRSNLALSDHTLADKAYSLVLFFRFLQRNSIDFFDLNLRTLKPFILHFKNELLFRVRAGEADTDDQDSNQAEPIVEPISHSHAQSVLEEVYWLCEWWELIETRAARSLIAYGKSRSPNSWRTPKRVIPECFRISIPKARRRFCENHVLEPSEVEAIWVYLTSEARPTRPKVLVKYPSGPRVGWSHRQISTWKTAQQWFRERLAWFHRQQMLWALLIGSAMRRSEVPLLMLVDVQFYGSDLWVALRLRKITEGLGRAKSGPRTIFIGWDTRIISAWQNWTRSRQVLIDLWMAKAGMPDHGMFLTNRSGGPLTVEGMMSLFEMLNSRFSVFGGEFPEDHFKLHPHAIRHTVEALFEEWGISHETRQRHLGHKKPATTDLYGKVYRKSYVALLSKLETQNMARAGGNFSA